MIKDLIYHRSFPRTSLLRVDLHSNLSTSMAQRLFLYFIANFILFTSEEYSRSSNNFIVKDFLDSSLFLNNQVFYAYGNYYISCH